MDFEKWTRVHNKRAYLRASVTLAISFLMPNCFLQWGDGFLDDTFLICFLQIIGMFKARRASRASASQASIENKTATKAA